METLTKNRTGIDFSEHELHITEQDGLLIHHLKKPNTYYECIKFINTNGIMAVTGDFGNWIFCREFHPSSEGGVSDMYWLEKLKIASSQEGEEFDSEATRKEIEDGIDHILEEYGYEGDTLKEAKEYYEYLLNYVDESEWYYEANAYMDRPGFIDAEDVPNVKKTKIWLEIIFDGFDEICRRMKEKQKLFDCGDNIIDESIKILREELGCKITNVDRHLGHLGAKTKTSLLSWGDDFEITLQREDEKIIVWVQMFSEHYTFFTTRRHIRYENKFAEALRNKKFEVEVEVKLCRNKSI